MASHLLQPLFILFLLTIINHHQPATTTTTPFHQQFILKLTKDLQTQLYTTQLLIGTPQLPTKLIVHLSGQSLWLRCPNSPNLLTHGSLQCSMSKSCHVHQQNPITGETTLGNLAEDVVTVDGLTVGKFLLSCSPEYLVNGAKGVLGFGRSKIAFQSQMVNNFDFPNRFSVCLSSTSAGFITSGGNRISKSLSYTPLKGVDGYQVNVNSIKINGRRLNLGQPIGDVEISSTIPYSVMKSSLYKMFKNAFVSAVNMTVVSPVVPFGLCFSSSKAAIHPYIELVLQSELVKWRIPGMVRVSDSVVCLGFVDGGLDMSGSVILGGYQLEDQLLEFDLGRGMMGFGSFDCSNINDASVSILKESL